MGFNFGFFGTPEHRVFNYKPRYYDPEKEALRQKFSSVDSGSAEGSEKNYTPGSIIKGSFRNGAYRRTRTTAAKSQKIIGLVGLILFFVVIMLIAKYYPILVSSLYAQ